MNWTRRLGMLGLTAGLLLVLAGPLPSESGEKGKGKGKGKPAPGTLKVHLPVGSEMTVILPTKSDLTLKEGKGTLKNGVVRIYTTPPLEPGKRYTYTLKSSDRDGGLGSVRMAVAVLQAGKETLVDMRPGETTNSSEIVFVPTAQEVVNKMLEVAKVTKKDVVYDLGCGNGIIVVTAAKKYGARGVGVDIDPVRIGEAKTAVKEAKVGKLVEIRQGDALKVDDLNKATVVMLYMLPEFMTKIEPILKKNLKPGTRIVSHDFVMDNWEPEQSIEFNGTDSRANLYVWIAGQEKKKKKRD